MTFSRKDVSEARNTGGNVTNKDGKMQNGMQLRTVFTNLSLVMLNLDSRKPHRIPNRHGHFQESAWSRACPPTLGARQRLRNGWQS